MIDDIMDLEKHQFKKIWIEGFGSINSKRSRLKDFVINGFKFGPSVWVLFWVGPIRMGFINISFENKLMDLGLLKSI